MKHRVMALVSICLLLPLACSTPEKKAKERLASRNIDYSEKGFLDSVARGQTEIVKLFLASGMSPNTQRGEMTALLEACRRGKTHNEIAAALIEAGAEINSRDPYGVTPLIFAAISGSPETMRLLMSRGSDVKAKDVDGRTALIEVLTTENEMPPEMVEDLIRAGADVNVRIYGGMTPLMIAAGGNPRILRALIEAGADLNARDDQGATPLRWAKDSPENYQLLKNAGAKE